eukprot:scaffold231464_cov32-Tisochrysis_lutea.AAC.3
METLDNVMRPACPRGRIGEPFLSVGPRSRAWNCSSNEDRLLFSGATRIDVRVGEAGCDVSNSPEARELCRLIW